MASISISNLESPSEISKSSVNSLNEQHRKLFIGGLSYTTSDEKLKEYFSTYGQISECAIMRDRDGLSRGFAFVCFEDRSQLDRFMKERPHTIDGRQVEAKRAMSREEASKPDGQLTVKKIFIGGIKDDITEQDLKTYFSTFGNLIDCAIMKDKDEKSRGFGFITFDDYDSVDQCILEKPHQINGKDLDVRKAIPRNQTTRSHGNPSRFHGQTDYSNASSMIISPPPLFSPFNYLSAGNFFSKPTPLMAPNTSYSPAGAILPPSTLFYSPEVLQNNYFSQQIYPTPTSPLGPTNSFVYRKKFLPEPTSLVNELSKIHLSQATINNSSGAATIRTNSRSTSTSNSEQHRKLFIGGLSFKTTDETLKDYVTKFGEVTDSLVMKDPTGQSRCFGFVTFADSATVDEFMKQRPHTLDGRQIDPKRAMPREEANNDDLHLTVKKIFIGGIRDGLDEQMLKDYFSGYGQVNSCLLMYDKDGKTRGFAFLEFDDFDSVDKVILARPHTIGDYRVDVKKAVPKDQRQIQLQHQQHQQLALQMQAATAACHFYYNNPIYNSFPGLNASPLIRSAGNGNTETVQSNDVHATNNPRSSSKSNYRRQSSRGSQ